MIIKIISEIFEAISDAFWQVCGAIANMYNQRELAKKQKEEDERREAVLQQSNLDWNEKREAYLAVRGRGLGIKQDANPESLERLYEEWREVGKKQRDYIETFDIESLR